MEFIKPDININFIGLRKAAFSLSLALIIISIVSLVIHKGPRYGVDFEGGLSIQVKFQNHVNLPDIQKTLDSLGVNDASVQRFGIQTDNEFQIRVPLSVLESLKADKNGLKADTANPPAPAPAPAEAKASSVETAPPAPEAESAKAAEQLEAAAPSDTAATAAAPEAKDTETVSAPAEKTMSVDTEALAYTLKTSLKDTTGVDVMDVSVDQVGAQASKDLSEKALLAIFFSLLLLEIYISGRFELKWTLSAVMAAAIGIPVYFIMQFDLGMGLTFIILLALFISLALCWYLKLNYALGAIVALIHDVTITVGVFSLLNLEITLQIVAALLTIIGYSLNDTIIVYDRIRENIAKDVKAPLPQVINRSINETLSRTTLTSLLTLLVVVALYAFGGSVIHNFAFAMIIGIVVGTYSSIYVASPILIGWNDKND
jgi:preprotein translocase subunit SecF